MKKVTILFLTLSLCFTSTVAQIAINTNGSTSENSAVLDVSSTTKGLLIPRMTNIQIQYIVNPANGLLVYCTDDNKTYCFHSGDNEWKELAIGASTLIPDAVFILGPTSTLSVANLSVGVPIAPGNVHIWISGTVTAPGYWSITTSVINGYSFSGSGTFTSTGTVYFYLFASGTPVAAQTDYFSTSAGGGWSWNLTVSP